MQLELTNPVAIAVAADTWVIISRQGIDDPMTPAQLWSPGNGYGDVQPLGVHLKWLYYLEYLEPPRPWVEPKKA